MIRATSMMTSRSITRSALTPALISLRPSGLPSSPSPLRSHLPSLASFSNRRHQSTICNSYAAPEVYDIAFSFRDFEAEVAYLLAVHQSHASGPLTRFLEIGCGPARHGILLSQAIGASSVGLDASDEMLKYAAQRAKHAGVGDKVKFVKADMAAAEGYAKDIPGGEVDVAAIMLGTLSHCLDNASALRCFKNVAAAVRSGGLLVIELAHPGELFGGSFLDPLDFVDCWEVAENGEVEFAEKRKSNYNEIMGERQDATNQSPEEDDEEEEESDDDEEESGTDGTNSTEPMRRVLVEYGREGDNFDAATQILERTVGLSFFNVDGELVSSDVSVVPQRQFSLQEIDLLGRVTGWEIVAVHGDLAEDVPLDGEDSYRMVVVLKKV